MLKTMDQHKKLCFAHIMKHWQLPDGTASWNMRGGQPPPDGNKISILRYSPPAMAGMARSDFFCFLSPMHTVVDLRHLSEDGHKKCYEQHENSEEPLRCPVKLYEFYLSKWYVVKQTNVPRTWNKVQQSTISLSIPSLSALLTPEPAPSPSTFSRSGLAFLTAQCGTALLTSTSTAWRRCFTVSSWSGRCRSTCCRTGRAEKKKKTTPYSRDLTNSNVKWVRSKREVCSRQTPPLIIDSRTHTAILIRCVSVRV